MDIEKNPQTVEEFDEFTTLPENADRLFEFIGGEIVEVPSSPYASEIASQIAFRIGMHLLHNKVGHLTGQGGGYKVSDERYTPDVAFISNARQPELAREGYNPNPPELAVEIISPTDSERNLRIKVANYLAAGTLVWLVDPENKEVEVYAPGQPAKTVNISGTLDGGNVLPSFILAVKDIFPGQ